MDRACYASARTAGGGTIVDALSGRWPPPRDGGRSTSLMVVYVAVRKTLVRRSVET